MPKVTRLGRDAQFHGVDATKEDPAVAGKSALFGETSFEPGAVSQDATPVKAAVLPNLFYEREDPKSRAVGAQPESFAASVVGIRRVSLPSVVDYTGRFAPRCFTARAGEGTIQLSGVTLSATDETVLAGSIDTRTGVFNCTEATDISNAEGFATDVMLSVDDSVIIAGQSWRDESKTHRAFVSKIDAHSNTRLWTTELEKSGEDPQVKWSMVTPSGDILIVCEPERLRVVATLLDASTGAVKAEDAFTFANDYRSLNLTRYGRVDAKNPPRMHPLWVGRNKVIFGQIHETNLTKVVWFSVDFETCTIEHLGVKRMPGLGQVMPLTNAKCISIDLRENKSEVFEFDLKGEFTRRPFNNQMPLPVDGKLPLLTNKTHGIGIVHEGLSFFRVKDDCFDEVEKLEIPDFITGSVTDLAITADSVAYVSRVISKEQSVAYVSRMVHKKQNDDAPLVFRLSAYDVTTRKELWSVSEVFKGSPRVIVNSDGSVAWLDHNRALIYEEAR